ncbi:hypothetical protein Adt_43388 [Abeliophyllum distichum]|uniref:Uncharacterized protein n=1 Tax=Abeliophyllum distichum TaxID=126358 RepID=A0ABD1P9D1_9LAMI
MIAPNPSSMFLMSPPRFWLKSLTIVSATLPPRPLTRSPMAPPATTDKVAVGTPATTNKVSEGTPYTTDKVADCTTDKVADEYLKAFDAEFVKVDESILVELMKYCLTRGAILTEVSGLRVARGHALAVAPLLPH